MSTVAILSQRRPVLADLVSNTLVANIALVTGAAALVGVLAQISIHIPHTPVPITGQTLGVLLAGSVLGWRRASLAMSLYLAAGIAGVPWFASHTGGYPTATFGYIIGFIAAGALTGWLASRGADRNVIRTVISMIAGELLIYAIGVPWLAVATHQSLLWALHWGMVVFIAGDIIKAALCGVALPSTWRIVERATKR
jgi:biotin transport system substrate-specific component